MALVMGLETINATIAAGTSLSPATPLGAKTLVGIAMPAGWDAAALSFQVSVDGGVSFQELATTVAPVAFATAASQYLAIDPATWRGVNLLKLRSGTAVAPVNQTADRGVGLVVRPL